jgi:hypothetical protein
MKGRARGTPDVISEAYLFPEFEIVEGLFIACSSEGGVKDVDCIKCPARGECVGFWDEFVVDHYGYSKNKRAQYVAIARKNFEMLHNKKHKKDIKK